MRCSGEWRRSLLTEMGSLLRLAVPMTVTQTLYGIVFPVTLAFCGSLGTKAIDQASLALSLFQLCVIAVEDGLRWTSLAFMGQVAQTGRPHRIGVYLQRGVYAAVACWLVAVAVCVNSGNLLILIGQEPTIAVGAERFLTALIPGCLGVLLARVLMAYLDSLRKVYPSMAMQAVMCGVCFGGQYLLLHHTRLGVLGAAVALSASLCLMPVMMLVYIWCSGVHRTTWAGWSVRGLLKWRHFFAHLMSTTLGVFTLFMGAELGTLLAGLLSREELAAQSIMYQVYILSTQIPFGLVSAGAVRISQHVSRMAMREQKTATLALTLLLAAMAVLFGSAIGFTGDSVPRMFSSDATVLGHYRAQVPYLAIYAALILSSWVFPVAFRSYNRSHFTLVITACSFFVFGHPVGISLAFAAGLRLQGLWIGYVTAGVAYCSLSLTTYLCVNWRAATVKVMDDMGAETEMESVLPVVPVTPDADETTPLVGNRKTKINKSSSPGLQGILWRRGLLFSLLFLIVFVSVLVRVLVPPQEYHGELVERGGNLTAI